jgi:serine/threonine-protein kinase
MTRAGYVLGTPYYMAPEQVMGQEITEQVDVYAFGVLLFELFAGVKPIQGDTVERIFYFILNEPMNLEPLRQAGAPQSVCDLVDRCTAKKPEDRPHGFSPVIADLERMIADQNAPTAVLPAMPMPVAEAPAEAGHPKWLLPAILAAVVVLGVALFFAMKPKPLSATISSPAGEMVLVPAGDFLFGEKKEKFSLPAFYIGKTEVTNSAYAQFCKESGRALPENFPTDKPDFPVVNVTILDALAFSQWAHLRLPNQREWEKAARGVDGRIYPWGNEPNPALANVGTGMIQPASALPGGKSPFGALNMVGNVWEFVQETKTPSAQAAAYFADRLKPPPEPSESWYASRGQSFLESAIAPSVLYDVAVIPARWKDANLGFRCVKDVQ